MDKKKESINRRRYEFIKLWFYLIVIFSILIIIFQIIYNYDRRGPQSYKKELTDEINQVFKYIVPTNMLKQFKDSDFEF